MQLTGPFRKAGSGQTKGAQARSYQNPRLAGWVFPRLFAQEKKKMMVGEGLGRGRKADPRGEATKLGN